MNLMVLTGFTLIWKFISLWRYIYEGLKTNYKYCWAKFNILQYIHLDLPIINVII